MPLLFSNCNPQPVYTGAHPPALQQGGKHGMPETIIRRQFTDYTM